MIHGLWGAPKHLSYIASQLRAHTSAHILVAKTNSNNLTYDGIDLGAERVLEEIENYIQHLLEQGKHVRKLSIVGYSLGGLIARYVVGLLYARGFFIKIRPVNFTTFATPHLGVRTPVTSFFSRLFNFLGSSTLSLSGRQLFTVDSFRDSGVPLLCVLADPTTIFMHGLKLFKHRVLYANIINDRSAPYYTTSISVSDPYVNLENVKLNYLPNYSPNILDPARPFEVVPEPAQVPFVTRIIAKSQSLLPQLPWFFFFSFVIALGLPLFLCNAVVQSVRSSRRIKLYEEGRDSASLNYRTSLMIENVQHAADGALNDVRVQTRSPEISSDSLAHDGFGTQNRSTTKDPTMVKPGEKIRQIESLPLSQEQLIMIRNLDEAGFRKYRVHIHKARHSHAAIIVRPRPAGEKAFGEGKIIVKHWLEEELEMP